MDDYELLQDYAAGCSESAFEELVTRYVNLVFSAARRQVGDLHRAEEVSQAVFLILSQKAGTIRRDAVLSSWLLRATRYTAANLLRREERRHHYEEEAMATTVPPSESDAAWERVAPMLDQGIDQLDAKNRDAIVLRFFEKKSFREIASITGTTEDSAQKRVSRAVDKLRTYFHQRGVTIPVAILGTGLAANSVLAAPAGLSASIGVAVAKGTMIATSVGVLVEHTVRTLRWMRAKMIALRMATIVVVAVTGVLVVNSLSQPNTAKPPIAGQSPIHEAPSVSASPQAAVANSSQSAPAVARSKPDVPPPDPLVLGSRLPVNEDVLRANWQVQGQVVDADTEKPVTRFKISIGRFVGTRAVFLENPGTSREFASEHGLFSMEIRAGNTNGLHAGADGYAEQAQRFPSEYAGVITMLLKHLRSPVLPATVVNPDSHPFLWP